MMGRYVLKFEEIDRNKIALVGGKAANLGDLTGIDGINVPTGFCITTEAFATSTDGKVTLQVEEEISLHLSDHPYAVRSSATAEDLPTASFAGQHDTYLNVTGKDSILEHISRCWSSLNNERAIAYRNQNNFDHDKVQIAVVVQKMVSPEVSGVLFTADPISGNRKVTSIDASFGLGEALVSGIVNADNYKVLDGKIVNKKISEKKIAIYGLKTGGTEQQQVDPAKQHLQALSDEQILKLEKIGRKIEKHFGAPQDIEWCMNGDTIYILQSRPITTLFPIPDVDDSENHVYLSVGHQQMMTDAMKPLGISIRQLTGGRNMYVAGGRMFADLTPDLASPARRDMMVNVLGKSDPLIRGALLDVLGRKNFIKTIEAEAPRTAHNYQVQVDYDPSVVTELITTCEEAVRQLTEEIKTKSGVALIDFIQDDLRKLNKIISDPKSFNVIMTGMNAAYWINDNMKEWLGDKNVADVISQSVPNNITSQMGLDLLDVADVIRQYPEVINYLQRAENENFLNGLADIAGGKESKGAIDGFLDKYGMRCVGEIDITRPRWREDPFAIVPMILSNINNVKSGESKRKFDQGKEGSLNKEKQLLQQLRLLENGDKKAEETKMMIDRVRNFAGYREYPKYHIVSCYFIYKKALLKEAEQLVLSKIIQRKEDIFFFSLEELREVIRSRKVDKLLIDRRKEDFRRYQKLNPPRVMTSDGEILNGVYNRDGLPPDAIIGLPVSSGVVEGRARVVLKLEDATFEDGDILVTSFTDPSWTPLFISIKGLVAEVGGLMTHGSVIAREYGLPAVVGVENATKLIKDGQRIRLNGTDGFIQVLE